MATKFLTNIDLNTNQLLNAKLQQLGSDLTPAAANTGILYYNTASNLAKVSNGTTLDNLTNVLESIAGGGAISVSAVSGKSQTIAVAAATGSVPGTMSAADYTYLHAATNNNTASSLVQRDASGNFSAGTITASLTGTASNATQLNGQAPSYYLSRANQTGTQTSSTISDLSTVVQGYTLNQFAAPSASVPFNAQRITGLSDPVNPQDAATKNYVDATAAGFDVKASVAAATTTNLAATYSNNVLTASANGALIVDGYTANTNDRILVKNQSSGLQNGIYLVTNTGAAGAAFVLTRSNDANASSGNSSSSVNPGMFVFVEGGTTNTATAWVVTTTGTISLGTTAITFAQVGAATNYTAGNGITIAGNAISAVGTANRVVVSGSGIDISAAYIGQTSITTLGTISAGTWQGTAVGIAYGGTGATTAAGAKTSLGFLTKYAQTLATSSTSYTVTHNLNTTDCDVVIQELSTGNTVYADVTAASVNTTTVSFATAPAASAYRVIVIG